MFHRLLALILAIALVGAACGGDSSDSGGATDAQNQQTAAGSDSGGGDGGGGSQETTTGDDGTGGSQETTTGDGGTTEGEETTSTQETPMPELLRGGVLRLAVSGGGPLETMDPHNWLFVSDIARMTQVYETLGNVIDGEFVHVLAESFESNEDASVWTIKLRQGVTWHDGSPFTAADVMYSIRRIRSEFLVGISSVTPVDLGASEIIDDHTIRIVFNSPQAEMPLLLTGTSLSIVKDGSEDADFFNPIGTGPFKVDSFTPGDRAVLSRYDNHWRDDPYLDSLEILSFTDPTAQANALLSGEVDFAVIPHAQRPQFEGSDFIVNSFPVGRAAIFYMRQDVPPFDNPAVRQAMRLAINRQSCVDIALSGNGKVANDIIGTMVGREGPSPLPQRTYDPDEARRILAEAGITDLSVELVTSNIGQGALECALAFAQHADAAGIEINVREVDPGEIYNPATIYGVVGFGTTQWGTVTFQDEARSSYLDASFFNETGESELNDLILEAEAILDPTERIAAYEEIERIAWERGGYIVWGDENLAVGLSDRVLDPEGWFASFRSPLTLFYGLQFIGVTQ